MKRSVLVLLLTVFVIGCTSPVRPVWKWTLESRCYADPVIDGEDVYIVSQGGEVVSGKYKTGTKNWSIKIDGPILADPDYSDHHVFTATQNGFIYALDKTSGKIVWKVSHPADHFAAPLTFSNDLLLVPSTDGNLFALSPKDGSTMWKFEGNRKYNTKPIVHGNYIFIGGWADYFYCLNRDGTVNWRYKASHVIVEPALIVKNIVYFTAHDHYVYALEVPTGKMIWRYKATYPTEMLIINDELVFGSRDKLILLDPNTGTLKRTIQYNRNIDRIYEWNNQCIAVAKWILQFNTKTGENKRLIPGKGPFFKIAFPPEMFIVSNDFNVIYGYSQQ